MSKWVIQNEWLNVYLAYKNTLWQRFGKHWHEGHWFEKLDFVRHIITASSSQMVATFNSCTFIIQGTVYRGGGSYERQCQQCRPFPHSLYPSIGAANNEEITTLAWCYNSIQMKPRPKHHRRKIKTTLTPPEGKPSIYRLKSGGWLKSAV